MTDEEMEELADELGDIQTTISYVLFRRSRPTLKGVGEKDLLRKAADRLQGAARRLYQNSVDAFHEDSCERQYPARRV